MKVTLEINNELLRKAKELAAKRATTLRQIFEDALRRYLSGKPKRSAYRLRWKGSTGKIRAGIDLDSREGLLDL